ncbi:hypothetical protein RMSM_05978 [Rhodopirellula maiorica SM1]|uniref:TIR domain-containing protein n=1 Tax=Rhodopirellula maiorica SM1 TaxID=1265738 RepID=M5RT04_9BACT|nr:toll/interleukin-1 receptor domain-containing protein [Rhodopirellula maiorica]EMI17104.1 hypothetical protein RMSM_05978 [Rhodopirellula maiorica SM1]
MNKMSESVIFFSHSKKDEGKAVAVLQYLRDRGYSSNRLFLDSDRKSGIVPGKRWEQFLFSKLQDTACLLVFGTENWCRSQWCLAEAFIAKNTDRIILPLDFDGSVQSSLVSEIQAIRNFDSNDVDSLESLLSQLKQLGLSPPLEDENIDGWTVNEMDQAAFERAAKQSRESRPWYWKQTPLAVFATFLLVGVLFLSLVAIPATQKHFHRQEKLAEYADCPKTSLGDTASMQTSELKEWMQEVRSDQRRISLQITLTERQFQNARDGKTVDSRINGFDARLYFKTADWWPNEETYESGNTSIVTGKVTSGDVHSDPNDSALDLGDLQLNLHGVKTITLKECVVNSKCQAEP